ncbi:MAG: tyrosine-type recombinase/integrase [Thermoproteota archaeon]
MIDIHDSLKRFESARRRVASLDHAELLLAFLDHLEALGLSKLRLAKYAAALCTILRNVKFNPAKATKQDVEVAVAWINRQPFREWTKHDLKLTLRRLVQFAKCGSCGGKTPVPDEVAWIPLRVSERDSHVKPEMLLTPEDVKAMIRAAENERDKALISVLFEAGLRPGELLGMRIGSVEFKENYCIIAVHGKTGLRRIPIVASYGLLLSWLEKHPRKGDPNYPLWTSLSNNSKSNSVSYYYFRKLVKKVAEKAEIRRDVWPYLFRHSSLTALAKVITESKLELYAGWAPGSSMPKRYVHLSARDLEETVLQLHGLKKAEVADGLMKPTECPRCRSKNPPDSVRCGFCGLILDRRTAIKMEEDEREKEETLIRTIKEMGRRLESLEQAVKSILGCTASSTWKPQSSKP